MKRVRNAFLRGQHALLMLVLLSWSAATASGVQVTPTTPSFTTVPGATFNASIRIENRATFPWSAAPRVDLPEGWRTLVPPAPVTLGAGAHATSLFTILVPSSAPSGTYEVRVTYGEVSAVVDVVVQARRALEVVLREAPDLVVAEPYSVTFTVTNRGNTIEVVRIRPEPLPTYQAHATPQELQLQPGQTESITVVVTPPGDLRGVEVHRLHLHATSTDDAAVTSVATARTEVAPAILPDDAIYHHATFRVRLSTSLDSSAPVPVNGWGLGVTGGGRLSDRDPGRFSVRLQNNVWTGEHENTLTYSREGFGVTIGNHVARLTPSMRAEDAFGISVHTTFAEGGAFRATGHASAYRHDGRHAIGAGATITVHDRVSLTATAAHTNDRGLVTHASATLLSDPDHARTGSIGVGYEHQWRDHAGHASLTGALGTDLLTLTAGWDRYASGFDGSEHDRTRITGRATARARIEPPSTASAPYTVTGSAWFEHDARTNDAGHAIATEAGGDRWGADATAAFPDVTWGLAYVQRHAHDPNGRSERQAEATVTLPLDGPVTRFSARPRLTWSRPTPTSAHTLTLVEAKADLQYRAFGGNGTASLTAAYAPPTATLEEVDATLAWSGQVTHATRLQARLELSRTTTTSASVRLGINTAFENGTALDVTIAPTVTHGAAATLEASMGITVPVRVRLGRRSDVAEVRGIVLDGDRAPVPGVQVRVASLITFSRDDGTFLFPAVPHGRHHLTVRLPSEVAGHIVQPGSTLALDVTSDPYDPIVLTVTAPARIEGTIELADGSEEPTHASALAGVKRPSLTPGLARGITVRLRGDGYTRTTVTDETGGFLFDGLPPGTWEVTVETKYLPTHYRIREAARAITVGAGEEADLTYLLEPIERTIQIIDGGAVGGSTAPP